MKPQLEAPHDLLRYVASQLEAAIGRSPRSYSAIMLMNVDQINRKRKNARFSLPECEETGPWDFKLRTIFNHDESYDILVSPPKSGDTLVERDSDI